MKKNFEMRGYAGILLVTTLFIFSCTKNDSTEIVDELNSDEALSATELVASDELDLISEEVTTLAEDIYAVDEIEFASKSMFTSDYLPDCVTITTEVTDTSRIKTIDFGDGCELRNGNILGGILILSYSKDMEAATKTLSLTTENFTFNRVAIEGSAAIERMRANGNGNPQSKAEVEFVAEWPEGDRAEYSANRTREWIEGYGSGFWGDNVFLITGMVAYKGKEGGTHSKTIVEPLRREMACRFIVSGTVEISRNDIEVSLDFGDGECDSVGTLTLADGTTEEIQLRRFHKKFPPKFPF